MTDEMNKNLENKELNLEQLEGVSGGLIVDCGGPYNYRVVDDKTGEILDTDMSYTVDAKITAEALNVSTEIINMDEYKRRFGKDIDLSVEVISKAGYPWVKFHP